MVTVSGLEGEWDLIELNGAPVISEQHKHFIVFDIATKQYSGNAGCNRMSGKFEYNESQPDKIQFARPMTTRMACPVLETEQRFLSALEATDRFESEPSKDSPIQIAFYSADNSKIIVIQKR